MAAESGTNRKSTNTDRANSNERNRQGGSPDHVLIVEQPQDDGPDDGKKKNTGENRKC